MFEWLLSGKWQRVRREHLEREPVCIACGRGGSLEVHHIVPYASDKSLELDPDNLATLCADPCHMVHGHLMSFHRSNPDVRADCAAYRAKLEAARGRVV